MIGKRLSLTLIFTVKSRVIVQHSRREIGFVHVKTATTPKLNPRSVPAFFVGHSVHHASDTFRMFNPSTQRVLVSKDVTFPGRLFYREDGTTSTSIPLNLDVPMS